MATLVLKEWKASNQPIDENGNYVVIIGRASGLLSWFLALIKINPTSFIHISPQRIDFSSASLSGTEHRIIPIDNVCSSFYGYHKPWKMAIFLFFISAFIAGLIGDFIFKIGWLSTLFSILVGAVVAIVHY